MGWAVFNLPSSRLSRRVSGVGAIAFGCFAGSIAVRMGYVAFQPNLGCYLGHYFLIFLREDDLTFLAVCLLGPRRF